MVSRFEWTTEDGPESYATVDAALTAAAEYRAETVVVAPVEGQTR